MGKPTPDNIGNIGIRSNIEAESYSLDPLYLKARNYNERRSQWLRGLSHELSSLSRTLGSWVRIPLKGIDVCVCVYSVFMLSCAQVAALRRADPPSKESYRLCMKDYENEEDARAQRRA
jgi:hypothetical protein